MGRGRAELSAAGTSHSLDRIPAPREDQSKGKIGGDSPAVSGIGSGYHVAEAQMKTAIELHDSECLEIRFDSDGNGVIVLDAYVHRTDGTPGISPGEGGVQRLHMSMTMMTMTGEVGTLPATIYEGSLVLDGFDHDNIVPLPLQAAGNATLRLMLADDARRIHVSGRDISVEAVGEFRFVENVDFSQCSPTTEAIPGDWSAIRK